jgi:hypothetical protein
MLKHIILLLGLSLAVVLGMPYAERLVQGLLLIHATVADLLTEVFSGGYIGSVVRNLIALMSVPLLIGLVPTLLYWLARKQWFAYFMEVVWIVWLIQAGALVLSPGTVQL